MARRVFFHVGTLKTGTTYLQRVMWENRDALREAGVLFAGKFYNDRVWAAQGIRGNKHPHQRAATAWDRIVDQVNAFPGDAIISHEFFGGASAEQAAQAMARVAPAEVHVVCTARDLIGILPAFWQEQVKFGYEGAFADYDPEPLTARPGSNWSWRTIDVADVLRRWAADVPPERVHVVTMPGSGAPRDLLWKRFAEVCGFDPSVASLDLPTVNESMGVAEAELLRRFNAGLPDELRNPRDIGRWLRGYLGLQILAKRDGEKLRVPAGRAAELREHGQAIVDQLREAGYHVVGNLDDIVGPVDPPTSRMPEEVAEPELLDIAYDVINVMLADVRRLTLENAALQRKQQKPQPGGTPGRERATSGSRARRVVRRARHLFP